MEQEPRNEAETKAYYKEKFTAIKNGSIEYVVRNFEADMGRCYDLFGYLGRIGSEGGRVIHYGEIHNDFGYGCDVYLNLHKKLEKINDKPLILDEAKALLRNRVEN